MARVSEKLTTIEIKKKLLHKSGMYGDGKGLWLRVSKPMVASWCFRYMFDKKAHEMGLGRYSSDDGLKKDGITLKRAREKAAACRLLLVEGQDPLAEREAVRAAQATSMAKKITFEECAQKYIEDHRAGWKNEKHAAQWSSTLVSYAYPIIGHLRVHEVDTGLVLDVLQQESENFGKEKNLWNARPETASRLRGRIEAVLDWATARDYRQGENPARWKGKLENLLPHRSKVAGVKHHPALPYAEIGGFMAMIRENNSPAARAFEFCVLTATRTSETLGATFDEIDIENKIWTIAAERMKAGKEHRVPLSPRAIEIIKEQKQANSDNFIFRSRNGGQLSNMAMLMLLRRVKRDDLTVHGFRSTFRDWAGETTAHPREVIEHALAHQLKDKSEAAYQRGDLFAKRRVLMDDWAAACSMPAEKVKAA